MKTLTIPIGYFDGEHVLMPEARLAKYPAENRHTLEVRHERLTSRDIQAVNAALNRRPDLHQQSAFDGRLTPGLSEGLLAARAEEIVKRTVKQWRYLDAEGGVVEEVEVGGEGGGATVELQPAAIVGEVAARIESPRIPPPPEQIEAERKQIEAEKNG